MRRGEQALRRTFGLRLRALREEAGVSREAFAQKAGFLPRYIEELEEGRRGISLIGADHLAAALGVSMPELVNISHEESNPVRERISALLAGRSTEELKKVLVLIRAVLD